jgi:hypothetical protein
MISLTTYIWKGIRVSVRNRLGTRKIKFLTAMYWAGFGVALFLTTSGLFMALNLHLRASAVNPNFDWQSIVVSNVPALNKAQQITIEQGLVIDIPAGVNPLLPMPLTPNLANLSLQGVLDKAGVNPQNLVSSAIPLIQKIPGFAGIQSISSLPQRILNKPISALGLTSPATFGDLGTTINDNLSLAKAMDIPASLPYVILHGYTAGDPGDERVGGTIHDRKQACDHKTCSSAIGETITGKGVNLAVSIQQPNGRSCTNLGCLIPGTDPYRYVLALENLGLAITKEEGNTDNLGINMSLRYCSWGNCTDYLGGIKIMTVDPNSGGFPMPVNGPGFLTPPNPAAAVNSTASSAGGSLNSIVNNSINSTTSSINNSINSTVNKSINSVTSSVNNSVNSSINSIASSAVKSVTSSLPSLSGSFDPSMLLSALKTNGINVDINQISAASKIIQAANPNIVGDPKFVDSMIGQILSGQSNPGATNPTGSPTTAEIKQAYDAIAQTK